VLAAPGANARLLALDGRPGADHFGLPLTFDFGI
jgi:hypothetical protein